MIKRFLLLLAVCVISAYPVLLAQDSAKDAKVLSVRQIRRASGLSPSRYAGPVYFDVDVALSLAGASYCVDYDTPVLDEVHDLMASNGKEIKAEVRGKKLSLVLPSGRRIRADLVKQSQC